MRTTAVFNHKGGVGKTTTVSAMADILAIDYGKHVLVIDADPQGNLSTFYRVTADEGCSTLDLFFGSHEPVYSDWISAARPDASVDIIPSDTSLILAEVAAAKENICFNKRAMAELFQTIREDADCPEREARQAAYDYILIDCSPSFNQVAMAALRAADDIIVPVTTDLFSTTGMTTVFEQIIKAREESLSHCLAGVLINRYKRAEDTEGLLGYLQEHRTVPVYQTVIHASDKVVPAGSSGAPLIRYSPRCAASRDYRAFVAEYLAQEGGAEHGKA